MGVVVDQCEVLLTEIMDRTDCRIDFHARKRPRHPIELCLHLSQVVAVNMRVPERVNELPGLQAANLRHHQGEQAVGGDVEGHAEKKVGTALVELAAEFLCFEVDVKLEEGVARRERHFLQFTDVPCVDNVSSASGVFPDGLDDGVDLVNASSVGRAPVRPLGSVNTAKIAFFIGPFIPDPDLVLMEVGDVGVPLEEPQKFLDDSPGVNLLCRHQRKALPQIVARLGTKDRPGADACSVRPLFSMCKNVAQKIEVRLHGVHRGRRVFFGNAFFGEARSQG